MERKGRTVRAEPVGDCVVVDEHGDVWTRGERGWDCARRRDYEAAWSTVADRGVRAVYRPEGESVRRFVGAGNLPPGRWLDAQIVLDENGVSVGGIAVPGTLSEDVTVSTGGRDLGTLWRVDVAFLTEREPDVRRPGRPSGFDWSSRSCRCGVCS